MATHNYIAERAKGFRTRVTVGKGDDAVDTLVQFVAGQYKTEDDDIAAAIDKAIAENKISRFCRKVDRAAAERVAADYIQKQKRMGAVQGQLSALSAKNAMNSELLKRDESLEAQNVDVEKLSEESGVQLTEKVDNPRVKEVNPAADPKVVSPIALKPLTAKA